MSAYLIADVQVTNPTQYDEYKKWSTAAMQAHGAEVCVRGGEIVPMEGGWTPERIVLLKFACIAAARAFYDSSQYSKAREARAGAAVMRMVIVEGL